MERDRSFLRREACVVMLLPSFTFVLSAPAGSRRNLEGGASGAGNIGVKQTGTDTTQGFVFFVWSMHALHCYKETAFPEEQTWSGIDLIPAVPVVKKASSKLSHWNGNWLSSCPGGIDSSVFSFWGAAMIKKSMLANSLHSRNENMIVDVFAPTYVSTLHLWLQQSRIQTSSNSSYKSCC